MCVQGNLEGVTSRGKHIMKMTNITFTYPTAPKPQLTGVTVRISLSTRAACIGANGAHPIQQLPFLQALQIALPQFA